MFTAKLRSLLDVLVAIFLLVFFFCKNLFFNSLVSRAHRRNIRTFDEPENSFQPIQKFVYSGQGEPFEQHYLQNSPDITPDSIRWPPGMF